MTPKGRRKVERIDQDRIPFPEPVASLRIGHVWNWPDVAKWAKRTGRL